MLLGLMTARTAKAFHGAATYSPAARSSNMARRTASRGNANTPLGPTTRLLHWEPMTTTTTVTKLSSLTRERSRHVLLHAAASSATATTTATKATKVSLSSRPYRLVIVESPSKCATIAKILNQYVADHDLPYDYQVTSCMGHVRNLPQKSKDKKKKAVKKTTKKSKTTATDAAASDATIEAEAVVAVVPSNFPYKINGIDLDHDYKPTYEILPGKEELVRELQKQARAAELVCLATDPDREGEAMAWHLTEILQLVDESEYQRITFSELTQKSIVAAVEHPVRLNTNLVHAQETRRILDRLAGFTVSPVLWKKIAPGLSAGRVQSVGMALTVQRERERLVFEETEYWDLKAVLGNDQDVNGSGGSGRNSPNVTAILHTVNGTIVANGGKDFASQGRCLKPESAQKLHLHQQAAEDMARLLNDDGTSWKVAQVHSRQRSQQAPQPYRTSTLQQEANRRLGMAVQQTMRTAQQLYEQGLISYMRTDSSHLSEEAQTAIVDAVTSEFGGNMVASPGNLGSGKKKKEDPKFAQEAHEAIRPAIQSDGKFLKPDETTDKAAGLSDQAKSLYRLIYQRSLAYRMPPLVTNQTQVVVKGISADRETTVQFRASGSVVVAPGYTMVYGNTMFDEDEDEPVLPPLEEGQSLKLQELLALGHQTQPPPRYTEASFVKELEALGVGRPSTYASVVQTLRDRAYVGSPVKDDRGPSKSSRIVSGPAISAQRAAGGEEFTGGGSARGPLVPSLTAFVVCSLLEKHCPTYVDPTFTSQMEGRLDLIASGDELGEDHRVAYLNEFYAGENGLAAQIKRIEDNVSADEARRATLPALQSKGLKEAEEEIALFIGPWGPYVQKLSDSNGSEKPPTASLPPGLSADLSKITTRALNAVLSTKETGGVLLGTHPDDGRSIRLKTGRFGAYLQWGEDDEEGTTTHSLPREKAAMRSIQAFAEGDNEDDADISLGTMLGISFEEAVGYVGLPRTVSTLDELPILAAIGPYGPYLKYNSTFLSLNKKDGHVLTIQAEVAEQLVTDGIINATGKKARGVIAELGEREESMVFIKQGRYGMYINWKKVNAKIPVDYSENPSELPLDDAWSLIQAKAGSAATTKKGGKSKNDPKLPPAPKRSLSAYLHFCAAKRPEFSKEANTLGEVSKRLAELWGSTSTADREEYDAMASLAKAEYQAKKVLWDEECQAVTGKSKSSGSTSGPSKTEHSKAKANLIDAPKRPRSAYIYFCSAKRAEASEKAETLGEVSKEIARMWAETEDRSEYQALAEADKARYEQEKMVHEGKAGTTQAKSKINQIDAPKRARSAYIYFCSAKRDEASEKAETLGEISKEISRMWAEIEDRGEYQALAEADKTRYEQEKTIYEGKGGTTLISLNGKQKVTAKSSSSKTRNGSSVNTPSVLPKTRRAPSAYMLFCREYRPTMTDQDGQKLPLGETTKRLASLWKECDEDARAKFQRQATEEKEQLQSASHR